MARNDLECLLQWRPNRGAVSEVPWRLQYWRHRYCRPPNSIVINGRAMRRKIRGVFQSRINLGASRRFAPIYERFLSPRH